MSCKISKKLLSAVVEWRWTPGVLQITTADSLPPVSDLDNIQNVVVKLEEVIDLDEINPQSPSTAPHVLDFNTQNVDVNMEEIADLEEGNLQRAEKPSTAGAQTALDVDAQDVVVKL